MNKYLYSLFLVFVLGGTSQASEIHFENGDSYDYTSIEVLKDGDVYIYGSDYTTPDYSSSSVSSSSSSSSSGGNSQYCQPIKGVVINDSFFTYGVSMGAKDITPPVNDGVVALPFTTGSSPTFVASWDFNGRAWTSSVTRRMWISECPGGEPISERGSCSAQGLLPRVQATQTDRSVHYCPLELNKDYYLNLAVKDDTCNYPQGCVGILAHKASGKID